jgi:hypothetical protein
VNGHDDLLERLRAADPAARPAAPAAPDAADRERVTTARVRRQSRRRARAGVAGGLTSFLGVLAIGLASGGGGGPVTAALPGVERIVAQAAHAALSTDGRIVEETIEFSTVSTSGGRPFGDARQRRRQWIRLDRAGRVRAYRTLTLASSDPATAPAGVDAASYRGDGGWWTDEWAPAPAAARADGSSDRDEGSARTTWRLRRDRSWAVPDSLTLRAARLMRRAQAGGGRNVELLGAAAVAGRRAYRLRTHGQRDGRWIRASRRELYVDARTYAPLRTTWHEHGVAQSTGRPFTTDSTVTIVERRVLPDTEANRRLLRARGPTR